MPIVIVLKDPFTTIAPVHDMVDSAGILDAKFARHGTKVQKRLVGVNSYDRPLFLSAIAIMASGFPGRILMDTNWCRLGRAENRKAETCPRAQCQRA
jgi:hypothetical protein